MWVLNGTGDRDRGARLAGYLDYHGLAASAPRQTPPGGVPADTTIVVYNGAETTLPATDRRTSSSCSASPPRIEADAAIRTDIIVTVGRATPDLEAPRPALSRV